MRMNGKELKERNFYTELFNDLGSQIEASLNKTGLRVRNLYEVAKKNNHQLEDFFHSHGKNYYTETRLSQMLIDYIMLQLACASKPLLDAILFENVVCLTDSIRIPIKNPHVKKYNQYLDLMESLAIDETLAERLGSMLTEERYQNEMSFVVEELKVLGYPELAETILVDTYDVMKSRKKKDSPEVKLKKMMKQVEKE